MSKRKCDDSFTYQPSKMANIVLHEVENCDGNVVIILDQFIESEDLKMKLFCERVTVKLLSSDEFCNFVESFGQLIVKDKSVLKMLRKRMNRNVWGRQFNYFNPCEDEFGLLNDKLFVIDHIKRIPIKYLSNEFKNDVDIIKALLEEKYLDETVVFEWLDIRNFALLYLDNNSCSLKVYEYIINHWNNDKEIMLKFVEKSERFEYSEREYFDDFESFLPESLRQDKSFLFECFKRNLLDENSDYVDPEWFDLVADSRTISPKANLQKEIDYRVLSSVSQLGEDIFLDSTLKNNKNFFMTAAREKIFPKFMLKYVPDSLLMDKKFMLLAIEANKKTVKYIRGELTKDRDILKAALKVSNKPIALISEELWNDRDFISSVATVNEKVISQSKFMTESNKEFIREALKKNGKIWDFMPQEYKHDESLVFSAITSYLLLIERFPEIKSSKQKMLLAIESNCLALFHASKELQQDKDLILKALECGLISARPDHDIQEELLESAIAYDFRSAELYNCTKEQVESFLTSNLLHKLKGNARYCKFIMSCLDLSIHENYSPVSNNWDF